MRLTAGATAFVGVVTLGSILAAGTVDAARHRHHGTANQDVADSMKVDPIGNYGIDYVPGVMGITGLVGIEVTAPLTLLDVRPYRVTSGVEVITRAYFWGRGTSPSGHPMFSGQPGGSCTGGPWPPTGYGPSFPIPGLRLAAGDPVVIAYYVRAPALPGAHVVTGYRIRYRTADGNTYTVTGDSVHLEMDYHAPDSRTHPTDECYSPRHVSGFAEPRPGYPH